MKSFQTVLRLNVQDQGSTVLWMPGPPPVPNSEIDGLLPSPQEELCGPNLASCAIRLSKNRFFLATTSRWDIADQFGRHGLSLAQGAVVEAPGITHTHLCQVFLALRETHEHLYSSLRSVLQKIATSAGGEERNLVAKLHELALQDIQMKEPTRSLVEKATANLVAGVSQQDRVRLFSDFPDSTELGFCLLLGLLMNMPPGSRVGGGWLRDPSSYHHIVSSREVTGFTTRALGDLLAETSHITGNPSPSPSRLNNLVRSPWAVWAFTLAWLTAWSLFFHESLISRLQSQGGPLVEAVEEIHSDLSALRKKLEIRVPTTEQTVLPNVPSQPSVSDSTKLEELTEDLFTNAQGDSALIDLSQNWSDDPEAIGRVVTRAEASLSETSKDSRLGLVRALQFLQMAGEIPIKANRARIENLLAEVKGLDRPAAGRAAEKVSQRLANLES